MDRRKGWGEHWSRDDSEVLPVYRKIVDFASRRSVSAPRERLSRQILEKSIVPLPGGRNQGKALSLNFLERGNEDLGMPRIQEEYEPFYLPTDDGIAMGEEGMRGVDRSLQQDLQVSETMQRTKTISLRCHCAGDSFDRLQLQDVIFKKTSSSSVRAFSEVMWAKHIQMDQMRGDDVLYFDWGSVVVCGRSDEDQLPYEAYYLKDFVYPCLNYTYPADRHESDALKVKFSRDPEAKIENDELQLHARYAEDDDVVLAVSFALAQSTKLRVCEEDLRLLVKRLSHIPEALAEQGELPVSAEGIMRHIGELYKQMRDVNTLGAALDLPDDLPSKAYVRSLYKAVYDYLEIAERLEVLNDRFSILRDLLELCRSIAQHGHADYLEKIIIYLIVVCGALAFVQLLAEFSGKLSS